MTGPAGPRSRVWLSAQLVLALWLGLSSTGTSAPPVSYRLSFPDAAHHVMHVEAAFPALGTTPLDLRMSRASPGRYSLHDFAKNVYGLRAFGADGRELVLARPDANGWLATDHGGQVRVEYDVFGDRVDGTYLAVDTTHAHINMPAAILWGRGLDDRAVVVTVEPPGGRDWRVATQLFAGATPFEFSAPNFQYLMDSPIEAAPIAVESFEVDGRQIRFATHHTGTAGDLKRFVGEVERIVREEVRIFGELPDFEPRHYTFLADYLPYAESDGMEHRNSSVLTAPSSIASDRVRLLGTVAHEFFHAWNVERIRPRALEPFDFERAHVSGELWLAEGFTQYYGSLVLSRAGLVDVTATCADMAQLVSSVVLSPARRLRSAVDMSRMATFIDVERTIDRTNWAGTVISYYQFGGAIALALDLSLRERSEGRVGLDDYMRALWRAHGRWGGPKPGYVGQPYTLADLEARLAEVAGDARFAQEFFARFIAGREVADYDRLLRHAGLVLRRPLVHEAWMGEVELGVGTVGTRLESSPVPETPLYAAGIDRDDEIVELGGVQTSTPERLREALRAARPGDVRSIVVADRAGTRRTSVMTLVGNPAIDLVPVESSPGGTLGKAQATFRRAWLGPQEKR